MTIPEIGLASSSLHIAASKRAASPPAGFDQVLADASEPAARSVFAPEVQARSAASATNPITWVSVAIGVDTATGVDGTKWTRMDVGKILTDADKQVLGWPSDDPVMGMLGCIVASDRFDGTIKGPITRDYILGNKAKSIVGLGERLPNDYMNSDRVNAMLDRLQSVTVLPGTTPVQAGRR
jgi:hypothetical protein